MTSSSSNVSNHSDGDLDSSSSDGYETDDLLNMQLFGEYKPVGKSKEAGDEKIEIEKKQKNNKKAKPKIIDSVIIKTNDNDCVKIEEDSDADSSVSSNKGSITNLVSLARYMEQEDHVIYCGDLFVMNAERRAIVAQTNTDVFKDIIKNSIKTNLMTMKIPVKTSATVVNTVSLNILDDFDYDEVAMMVDEFNIHGLIAKLSVVKMRLCPEIFDGVLYLTAIVKANPIDSRLLGLLGQDILGYDTKNQDKRMLHFPLIPMAWVDKERFSSTRLGDVEYIPIQIIRLDETKESQLATDTTVEISKLGALVKSIEATTLEKSNTDDRSKRSDSVVQDLIERFSKKRITKE